MNSSDRVDIAGDDFFITQEIERHRESLERFILPHNRVLLASIADRLSRALRSGGRILFCGNGGSAADAQHLAAELVGRLNYDRGPAAGIALTVDTSVLTAVGNDYGFDEVYARQVRALGRPGDVLVALSTSGRSPNVLAALAAARSGGLGTVLFTGEKPGELAAADLVLAAPSSDTTRVQELHILAGHIVCGLTERSLFPEAAPTL